MQIHLADISKFVRANPTMVGEVSNPIAMERGNIPTVDGLLSTEVFGNSVKERSRKFGWIDLHGKYFQPIVYKNIKRLDRRVDGIIAGRIKVKLDSKGHIVEDPKGDTGLDFFYKNWEKIKYPKNDSSIRNERIELFENHSKAELFTDKWIVSPAMYRDVNLQDASGKKVKMHEINAIYARLISLVSMVSKDGSFTAMMHNTRLQIQSTIVEIYDYYKHLLEKKNGLIRKSLLGKNIDYGARLVITAPLYNYNSYKDTPLDFYHAGVPMANCCTLFTPFILGWVRNFLRRELEASGDNYTIIDKGKPVQVKLKDPMGYFNETKIREMMDMFVFSYDGRFNKIQIPIDGWDNKKNPKYMVFTGTMNTPGSTGEHMEEDPDNKFISPLKREMTLTDLFYIAAVSVCRDKHVYITRYPITDYLGVYPMRIHVLSTHRTCKLSFPNGDTYDHYPVIDINLPPSAVASEFQDTVQFQNCYLSAIGGDYDGDQITVKGVFSQSANVEAEAILLSKRNILDVSGNGKRKTTNETVQTLFSMSRFAAS